MPDSNDQPQFSLDAQIKLKQVTADRDRIAAERDDWKAVAFSQVEQLDALVAQIHRYENPEPEGELAAT